MKISKCMCGKKPEIIPGEVFYTKYGAGMIEINCVCGCSVRIIRKDKPKYSFLRKTVIRVWNEICGKVEE